jgi:hypothetical protein
MCVLPEGLHTLLPMQTAIKGPKHRFRQGDGRLVMARRSSKHLRPARPLSSGHATSVIKSDGRWIVRSVSGAAATKAYRCPGCNVEIRPGTPHVVTWPDAPGLLSHSAVEERRHWHTSCWQRRP